MVEATNKLSTRCLANRHSWTNPKFWELGLAQHPDKTGVHNATPTPAAQVIEGKKRRHRRHVAPSQEGFQTHLGLCCCLAEQQLELTPI